MLAIHFRPLALLWVVLALAMPSVCAQEDSLLDRLREYLKQGDTAAAREAIRKEPAEVRESLKRLVDDFDRSIHSMRNQPEQRRVRYSEDLLNFGIELGRLYAQEMGDRSLLMMFEIRQDRIQATKWLNEKRFREALDLIEGIRSKAEELQDTSFLVSTYISRAYAYLGLEQSEKALGDCEKALELARRLDDAEKLALSLYNVGAAYLHLGRYADSVAYSRDAAEAAKKVGKTIWEGNAWLNLGSASLMSGDFEQATRAFTVALELFERSNDVLGKGRAFYNLGIVFHRRQQWELAAANLEKSLPFVRDVDIRHSHDIDDYNEVEGKVLELLLSAYQNFDPKSEKISRHRKDLEELLKHKPSSAPAHGHHH
ncbi:MAG: tetratricopeptide repeat protein [Acidobacteria bacterium]|nr:tetratricopeptide repeat protein [Acidobacteriota bacterium]